MARTTMTLRKALRAAREHMARIGKADYLPAAVEFDCDRGILFIRNRKARDGGLLLGVFEAELVNERGLTVRKYAL